MLHGTRHEVRDGDHVLLGERVGDVEVVGEVVGDVCSNIKRVLDPAPLLGRGVHSELGLVDAGQLLFKLEVTNNEAGQVGHHWN